MQLSHPCLALPASHASPPKARAPQGSRAGADASRKQRQSPAPLTQPLIYHCFQGIVLSNRFHFKDFPLHQDDL